MRGGAVDSNLSATSVDFEKPGVQYVKKMIEFLVSLEGDLWNLGGAAIAKDVVLSVAHGQEAKSVGFGHVNRLYQRKVEVDAEVLVKDFDLKLLRVKEKVLQPAPSGWDRHNRSLTRGEQVLQQGWGAGESKEAAAIEPLVYGAREVLIPVLGDDQCSSLKGGHRCVGIPGRRMICRGDSGTPVVRRESSGDQLVGIVAQVDSHTCGQGPGIVVDLTLDRVRRAVSRALEELPPRAGA